MRAIKSLIVALAFLFVSHAARADTQVYCMPVAALVQGLSEMGETTIGAGTVANQSTVVVIFASAEKKTWTLAGVDHTGKACVLAWGTGWTPNAPITPAESK